MLTTYQTKYPERLTLRDKIYQYIDDLVELGVDLPESLKRRDKREPRRKDKELVEDMLQKAYTRHFQRKAKLLRERLTVYYPNRKSFIGDIIDFLGLDEIFNGDDELERQMVKLIGAAAVGGVELFEESVTLQMDYTMVYSDVAEWARKHAGKAIKDINATTLKAVRKSVSRFVETPGYTIGDIMGELTSHGLDAKRARMIAITETTNAYAEGQKLAGIELQKKNPGVLVIKRWYTNNDDRVCDICGPLNGKEVAMDEMFDEERGISQPAAHVNCRCWMSTQTRINA